jgi:hypothetical protein
MLLSSYCRHLPFTNVRAYTSNMKYIRWIVVNWDTLGIEHFVPIKRLPQLWEMLCKEVKIYTTGGVLPFTKHQTNFNKFWEKLCHSLYVYKYLGYKTFHLIYIHTYIYILK